jgi:hypothetical protein
MLVSMKEKSKFKDGGGGEGLFRNHAKGLICPPPCVRVVPEW